MEEGVEMSLTDICQNCKKRMELLYNAFFTIPFFAPEPEIRGQVCDNKKCKMCGVERRHERHGERMTRDEYLKWRV